MSGIQFESGKFVALKARTKFHLGSLEKDVNQGDVIYFDGEVAKIAGKEHNLQQIGAAVRAGWLVPVDSASAAEPYRPQPAKMEVRPAQSTDKDRGASRELRTIHDEERDLGNLKKVRDRGDGVVRREVVAEDASGEGVAVGKIKRAAVQKTILTAENATRVAQEINKIDNVQGTSDRLATPLKAVATGDVQEARSGDALDELLGDSAVSSEVPAPGPAGEGNSPHLTGDEKAMRVAAATEAARRARKAQVGAEEPKEAAPAPSSDEEAPEQIDLMSLAAKVALVRAVIPKFEWDMTRHWKVRVADAVKTYGKNPLYMNGILSLETEAVKNYISQALAKGYGSP